MGNFHTSARISRLLLWVIVFSLAVASAVFWVRDELQPFFMTRPSINGIIVGLGLMGFAISVVELLRLLNQARAMDSLAGELASGPVASIEEAVNRMDHGLVRDRSTRTLNLLQQGGLNMEALTLISDADVDSEEGRGAFVRYVLGVMVFLGLIGTFWGVLITVEGVQKVLEALEPSRVNDPLAFVTQLKSSMGGLLGGLSTAFSTSLFGLSGSVILGFVDLQTRKARSQLLADLDRFVVSVLTPAAAAKAVTPKTPKQSLQTPEFKGDQFYHLASQQALAENLRTLTDVLALQSTTDEKVTDSIVEIKGIVETLREEESRTREATQSSNLVQQGLLERMDSLGRHLERLVKEIRLAREASDDMGKALLDRMKLEGEITNKTLSMGFSDLIRNLDRVREAYSKRGDPEKDNRS